jgi:GTP-binding protein LepA
VVWASIYPESQDDFTLLKQALLRLRLSDSAFSFEEESSGVLGRGYRSGFLGMLHLEIITERLRREFNLSLIITLPSITYQVKYRDGKEETIYTPSFFPEEHLVASVREPWVRASIITPPQYLGQIMTLLYEHEAEVGETKTLADRTSLTLLMPLRELMRGFFDALKARLQDLPQFLTILRKSVMPMLLGSTFLLLTNLSQLLLKLLLGDSLKMRQNPRWKNSPRSCQDRCLQ